MRHFHIVSAGWGFGPTVAQTHLLGQLNRLPLTVTLDVPRRALPVLQETLNHVTMSVQRKQRPALKRTENTDLSKSTVINFGRTELLVGLDCETHYFVDCAAWQNGPTLHGRGVFRNQRVRYLVEFFPPLRKPEVNAIGTPIQPCLRHVNANLILAPNEPGVLITAGGGIAPGKTAGNPLVNIVRDVMALVRNQVRIIGGEIFGGGSGRVVSVSHEQHLSMIASATMVLTVPGLYTVFETLQRGRTVALLPPTNYTQLIQYCWYRSVGMVDDGLDWVAHGIVPVAAPQSVPPSEEVAFTAHLRQRLRRRNTTAVIKEALVSFFLDRPFARSERLRAAQQAILRDYLESDYPDLVSLLYEGI